MFRLPTTDKKIKRTIRKEQILKFEIKKDEIAVNLYKK
jgi:hypothetical protein